MSTQAKIFAPSVMINGEVIPLVPNSFSLVEGLGTSKLSPQSLGGGQVTYAYSQDLTTAKGGIKFKIYPTLENIEIVRTAKSNKFSNLIQYVDQNGLAGSMSGAIVSNDPEYSFSADGEVEVIIEGNKAEF
jgi:hypothetical protein